MPNTLHAKLQRETGVEQVRSIELSFRRTDSINGAIEFVWKRLHEFTEQKLFRKTLTVVLKLATSDFIGTGCIHCVAFIRNNLIAASDVVYVLAGDWIGHILRH